MDLGASVLLEERHPEPGSDFDPGDLFSREIDAGPGETAVAFVQIGNLEVSFGGRMLPVGSEPRTGEGQCPLWNVGPQLRFER